MSIFYSNHVNPFSRQLGLSLFQSFSTKKKEKKNLRTLCWSLILLFLYFFEMSNIRTDWRHLYVGPTKCKSKITTVMGLDSDNVISVFYGEKFQTWGCVVIALEKRLELAFYGRMCWRHHITTLFFAIALVGELRNCPFMGTAKVSIFILFFVSLTNSKKLLASQVLPSTIIIIIIIIIFSINMNIFKSLIFLCRSVRYFI